MHTQIAVRMLFKLSLHKQQESRSTVAYTFAEDPNTTTSVSSTEKISKLAFSIQTQSGEVVFKSGLTSSHPTSFFLLNLD